MSKIETIRLTYYIEHDAYGGATLYINAPHNYPCKSLCSKHFYTDDVVVDDTHAGVGIQLSKMITKQINDSLIKKLKWLMSIDKADSIK